MTTFFFLLRLALTAALIYAAVWLDSKIAMTVLFGLLCIANEVTALKFWRLSNAINGTIGAAAQRIKERQEHRRVHGKRR